MVPGVVIRSACKPPNKHFVLPGHRDTGTPRTTTYQGQNVVLRHTRIGMQFYGISGSGHCFATYPALVTVLRHTRAGNSFTSRVGPKMA